MYPEKRSYGEGGSGLGLVEHLKIHDMTDISLMNASPLQMKHAWSQPHVCHRFGVWQHNSFAVRVPLHYLIDEMGQQISLGIGQLCSPTALSAVRSLPRLASEWFRVAPGFRDAVGDITWAAFLVKHGNDASKRKQIPFARLETCG